MYLSYLEPPLRIDNNASKMRFLNVSGFNAIFPKNNKATKFDEKNFKKEKPKKVIINQITIKLINFTFKFKFIEKKLKLSQY